MNETNPVEEISFRLQKAMNIRGLRQRDLVEKTGIPKSSINQYLSGYAEPKTDRIGLLAQALEVDPVWLMGFDVPMETREQIIEQYKDMMFSKTVAEKIMADKTVFMAAYSFMQLTKENQELILGLMSRLLASNQVPFVQLKEEK